MPKDTHQHLKEFTPQEIEDIDDASQCAILHCWEGHKLPLRSGMFAMAQSAVALATQVRLKDTTKSQRAEFHKLIDLIWDELETVN